MIRHEGDKWVLYSQDGKKKLGTHDTKAEAEAQERTINIRKYARVAVVANAAAIDTREETLDGVDYLVVPVVALVEGVLHAMNSADPEMVFAEEFTKPTVVGGFNGRPLYYGHPIIAGEPVSGNDPKVWEELNIGKVFHTAVKKNKLVMEAWIDKVRAAKVAPDLLERIAEGKAIEISVGVFCESDADETGEYNGKKYAGAWRGIVPDHLALLVDGDTGACSNAMGCGVRTAKQEDQMKEEALYAEFRTLRNIPQEERDKMPASDFAGPGRSFPIAKPEDVAAAAHSLGRAKGNTNAIKRKIIAIAYRKGPSFVAQLPEEWKKKKDQKNASMFARIMNVFRAEQATEEMSDNDIRRHLLEALRETDRTVSYVEAYYPNSTPPIVVYSCYCPESSYSGGSSFYQREYSLGENGKITLGENPEEVEPILTYQPVTEDEPVAPMAAQGAPCRCKNKDTRSAIDMTKEQITKFLETATDEQIKALSAVVETPAATTETKVETPAVEAKVENPAAVETKVETPAVAAKAPTFEELLEKADQPTRDAINSAKQVGNEKRAASIKALKDTGRCELTDAELAGKSQAELDQLVKLAGSAAVNFAVAGGSKAQDGAVVIPAAPDMTAAIKAARGIK